MQNVLFVCLKRNIHSQLRIILFCFELQVLWERTQASERAAADGMGTSDLAALVAAQCYENTALVCGSPPPGHAFKSGMDAETVYCGSDRTESCFRTICGAEPVGQRYKSGSDFDTWFDCASGCNGSTYCFEPREDEDCTELGSYGT